LDTLIYLQYRPFCPACSTFWKFSVENWNSN